MKKVTFTFLLFLILHTTASAVIEYRRGSMIDNNTARLWFNSDTPFGQSLYAQARYGSTPDYTGFVEGNYDDTTYGDANWYVDIVFPGGIPTTFEIEGAKGNSGSSASYEYTGFPWSQSRSSLLPVVLESFKAVHRGSHVWLQWSTSLEINNSHFIVERSEDSNAWKEVGKVEGNGTTTDAQNYEFIDGTPLSQVAYYRLKQVDLDGQFAYSTAVSVHNRGAQVTVEVYPNPTSRVLNLHTDRNVEQVQLVNLHGKIVWQTQQPTSAIQLPELTKGAYLLRMLIDQQVVYRNVMIQ